MQIVFDGRALFFRAGDVEDEQAERGEDDGSLCRFRHDVVDKADDCHSHRDDRDDVRLDIAAGADITGDTGKTRTDGG